MAAWNSQQGREELTRKLQKKIAERDKAFSVPNYQQQYDQFSNVAGQAQGREAGGGQFRDQQADLLRQLQADAAGNGPSQQLIRMQAQGMADRGGAQQLAMASGARPGQTAMAGRNAAFNAANLQSQVGGQAAQAGLQARMGAMGQLGQFAGSAREGDLRQLGLNDSTQLEALRQRLALSGMGQQGNMSLQQLIAQQQAAKNAGPSMFERGLGAIGQGAEIYANYQTGGGYGLAKGAAKAQQGSGGGGGGGFNMPNPNNFNL